MDDHVCILGRFRQMSGVRHIPDDQPATIFSERFPQPDHVLGRTSPAEIIIDGHLFASFQQAMDIVRSDKPGSTGDKIIF